jgi:hypothetical protein
VSQLFRSFIDQLSGRHNPVFQVPTFPLHHPIDFLCVAQLYERRGQTGAGFAAKVIIMRLTTAVALLA